MQVAPNQISPGEPFDAFYFIRNPLDNTTYYVRAKIYDVRTGVLLDTIVLDQSPTNARLFIKTVQAPPDPSGYGRNIVAIASVYTDNGFTSQSESYEEQEQYYLIKTVAPILGGGGVDYRALKEMIEGALDKRFAKLPKPSEPTEFPADSILGSLGALQRELNLVPKESPEACDHGPLLTALGEVKALIADLPEPKEADLSEMLALHDRLPERINESLAELVAEVRRAGTDVIRDVGERMRKAADEMVASVSAAVDKKVGQKELSIPLVMRDRAEAQQAAPDFSHLM